jgi:uncharacterized delta-60 repeat protein
MQRLSLVLVCAAACGKVSATPPGGGDDDDGDGGTSSLVMTVATGRQFVRQGGMLEVEVDITRQGVTGAVDVTAQLPLGVTADPLTIADGVTTGTLVVHADPAAPFARTQVVVSGALGAQMASSMLDLDVIGTPGTLDTSFGSGGVTSFTMTGSLAVTPAFAVADDDGVIAALYVQRAAADGGNGIAVFRLAHHGALDPGFGDAGQLFVSLGAVGLTSVTRITGALQSDRKIVIAGSGSNGSDDDPFIVRLTAAGQLDATLPLHRIDTSATDDSIDAIAIGPSDEIVLGGSRTTGQGMDDGLLVRLDHDGVRDPAFGTNGMSTFHDQAFTLFMQIATQADGRIVVAEEVAAAGAIVTTSQLRRFGTDAHADATFGTAGVAALSTPSGGAGINQLIAIDGAALVVTGGMRTSGFSASDDAMWRYLATGALDTTFAGLGAYGPATPTLIDGLGPVAVDAAHGYYAAGTSETQAFSTTTLHLVHLDATGAPDPAWGTAGDLADPIVFSPAALVMRVDHRLVTMGSAAGITVATAESFRAYWY